MIDCAAQGHSSRRLRDPRKKAMCRVSPSYVVDVEAFVQQVVTAGLPPPFSRWRIRWAVR